LAVLESDLEDEGMKDVFIPLVLAYGYLGDVK
jgi:hypothetical protein